LGECATKTYHAEKVGLTSASHGRSSAAALAVVALFHLAAVAHAARLGPAGAPTTPRISADGKSGAIPVIVKLDYEPIASYAGGVGSLAATSPSATGRKLGRNALTTGPYAQHVAGLEAHFLADLARVVPEAHVGQTFRVVYGGVALSLPANRIRDVLAIPGVVAVQADALNQPDTDSSPAFIGAPSAWTSLGGQPTAGSGLIVGVFDTGVWPEHPSFADTGVLSAPRPTADGTARACTFGDNPLTPANDPFGCNNKLIGGRVFLDAYNAAFPGSEQFPDSARDSNGHGTHVASTAAGDPLAHANPLGLDRGPISGIAPGAAISVYKVCGEMGCKSSDSLAALERAILDDVDVINYSINNGTNPITDPVELAFLDAYEAGIVVVTSAGDTGPGAGTVGHQSPWVMSVAASTQTRTFTTTLELQSTSGSSLSVGGVTSITSGVGTLPVVLASAPPYNNATCNAPAPPGTFTGKMVVCENSGAGIETGFNVFQGGAAAMILYGAPAVARNHWLPTVHLADGTDLLAFLAANTGVTGSFAQGTAGTGTPDVVAAFSSRGPGGLFLKPDVAAPGVNILAGQTPDAQSPATSGPPGNLFQLLSGTSMAAPHVAGAALLVKALNPTFTPGQVKSALMTTAVTAMLEPDGATPANPFSRGAGRIDVARAGNPSLTFDETAARLLDLGDDPTTAVDLNLPSINVTLPNNVETVRTFTNVSGQQLGYTVATSAQPGSVITVQPTSFSLAPGASVTLAITIGSANAPGSQEFGEIILTSNQGGGQTLRLPVAFLASGELPTTDVPLDGERIRLIDARGPAGRRTKVSLRNDGDGVPTPDPTLTGATVHIGRIGAGSVTVLDLPASGWSIMGSVRQDFKFKSATAPIIKARLSQGRAFSISARGDAAYPLGGVPQGGVGVIVDVGDVRFCGFFGGLITKDDGIRFRARRAPAPASCPQLGPTTTTSSTSTSSTTSSSTSTSSR
jgi:subtilisin family serine protease